MFINLLLRTAWTISLIPNNFSSNYSMIDVIYPFLAILEQTRRTIWGILKIEYEHIKASSKSKAAIFINDQFPKLSPKLAKRKRANSVTLPHVPYSLYQEKNDTQNANNNIAINNNYFAAWFHIFLAISFSIFVFYLFFSF
jgi:hypothetical protein